jgi:hypothetical protein
MTIAEIDLLPLTANSMGILNLLSDQGKRIKETEDVFGRYKKLP